MPFALPVPRLASPAAALVLLGALAACGEPTAPPKDIRAPQVSISGPTAGTTTSDSTVTLDAVVTDSSGTVSEVSYVLNDGPPVAVAITRAPSVVLHFQAGPLRLGPNAILLRAADAAGNRTETFIQVARIPPITFTLSSPAEGDTVWGRAVPLTVSTSASLAGATYTLNGGAPRPMTVFTTVFGDAYDLQDGQNTIVVEVVDDAGHKATRTVHVVSVVPAVRYSVTQLTMPGATASTASGMNEAGTVAGSWTAADGQHAVAWTNGAAVSLAPLATAVAISPRGLILGAAGDSTYLWDNGTVTRISTDRSFHPVDVNDQGYVLCGLSNGSVWHAGQINRLAGVPYTVRGINSYHDVVGAGSGLYYQSTRWDSAASEHTIGFGRFSEATEINEARWIIGWGSIRGYGGISPEYEQNRAFFYNGTMTDLSSTVGFATVASRLSANGTVVGSYQYQGQPRLYLWRGGKTTDVVLAETGWTIESVVGVNDRGQIAVNGHQGTAGPATALLLNPAP
jgi:hypothetical protein